MTNKEFYKEQIVDIVYDGYMPAVNKKTKAPTSCWGMSCEDCALCATGAAGI